MSISSEEITTSATLEQFRVQFNNLVSDVQGLESGTASFSNIEVKPLKKSLKQDDFENNSMQTIDNESCSHLT